MKKQQLILGSVLALSLVAVPMVAQARHGADDPITHVRQEDKATEVETHGDDVKAVAQDTTANNGQVAGVATTNSGRSHAEDESEDDNTVVDATITLEQATAIAQEKFADKTVYRVEQEVEHGVLVWRVRFTDGSRVEVDATTGEIVRSRDRALEKSNSGSSNNTNENNSGRSSNSGRDHSEDD